MTQQINVPGIGVVNFPDGMTDEQMAAAIKASMPDLSAKAVDVGKSAASGVGRGLIGLAGLPGDVAELGARGLDRAVQFIGDKLGLENTRRPEPARTLSSLVTDSKPREKYADRAPTYGSADIQKVVEGVTGEFYKPQTTAGKYAHTVGEFAPGLIGGGGAGALARRAVTNVVAPGVASEAAGQATEGTKAEPYARVAAAMLGGVAPSMAARAVTPAPASPARQRLVDILEGEGVTSITAGQRTGNDALRYAESTLGNAPFTGQPANRIAREGQEQFTDATLRRAGTGGTATPEVLADNQRRLTDQFRDLSARNTLQMDPQFGQDVTRAVAGYQRVPPSQQRAIVEGYVDDIVGHIQQGGTMPGPVYQEMRSRLSRQANGLRQTDPTLSDTLRNLRNALDDAMGRSISTADRDLWQATRREYGAQKVIEKAASRAGEATAEGIIVPANLRNTVAAENRGAYARGQGDFSELSRAGSAVLAPLPNSGTAQRSNALKLFDTLTLGIPNAVAGRLLLAAPTQRYLSNQVAAPMLRNLTPGQSAVLDAMLAAEQQRLATPK